MFFPLFTAVSLLVFAAANARVYHHAARLFRLGAVGRGRLFLVQVLLVAAMLAVRPLEPRIPRGVARAVGSLVSGFELAIVIAAVLLVFVDAASLASRLAVRFMRSLARAPHREVSEADTPPESAAAPIERRAFLQTAAVGSAMVVGAGASAYGVLFGRHDYQIEERPIRIRGLPRQLDGFTIVQLSDIHIGTYVGEPELRAAIDRATRARPDLIALTGDLIDRDIRYADRLGGFVRQLRDVAAYGVAVIPGNHDWYTGVDRVLATAARAGADVLRNRGRVIGDARAGFALLGVEDVFADHARPGAGPDLEAAMRSVAPDLPRILLCHNPIFFSDAAASVALQLSGHTHAGQLGVGRVSPVGLMLWHPYTVGLYQRGDAQLYVNRGFGTVGPPARIGEPPEVTRIVLVAA